MLSVERSLHPEKTKTATIASSERYNLAAYDFNMQTQSLSLLLPDFAHPSVPMLMRVICDKTAAILASYSMALSSNFRRGESNSAKSKAVVSVSLKGVALRLVTIGYNDCTERMT